MSTRLLQPAGWAPPKGYANGVSASGRLVFVAGQVGWTPAGGFESDDFVAQVAQALRNVVAVLAEGGARPEHIARMTWYVTDRDEYLRRSKEIGAVYREIIGRHYPAMTAVDGEYNSGLRTRASPSWIKQRPPKPTSSGKTRCSSPRN
jgi:enamine deaminase RidA (YjgF/YER057c/UK114 family)